MLAIGARTRGDSGPAGRGAERSAVEESASHYVSFRAEGRAALSAADPTFRPGRKGSMPRSLLAGNIPDSKLRYLPDWKARNNLYTRYNRFSERRLLCSCYSPTPIPG